MYACYLDDSYASDGAVITIAGYVATEETWKAVEAEMEALYRAFEVDVLHAMEFHRRQGCFKGWKRDKRKAFVHGIGLMTRNLTMAISVNVNRGSYKARQAELNINAGMSAYCIAFSAAVHSIARGNSIWHTIDEEGLRFVVEHGNQNNAEIAIHFETIKQHGIYGDCLRMLEFSAKDGSRAIQLADFFALYSRRWADRSIAEGGNHKSKLDDALETLDQYLPHRMHVVNEAYGGMVEDHKDTFYMSDRPPGPMPSEKPVAPRPMRKGDKRQAR